MDLPGLETLLSHAPSAAAWIMGSLIVIGSAKHLFDSEQYDIESGERAARQQGVPHFDAPLLPKYATSRLPYWTWLVIYMALPVGIFALASWQWSTRLPGGIDQGLHTAWQVLLENYPPLLVALFMHGMGEVLNGPRSPISWWRLFCLRNARVPVRAREIYLKMRDQPIRTSPAQRQDTVEYINQLTNAPDNALLMEDFELHPDSVLGKWARAGYFMAAIERHRPRGYGHISSRPELKRDAIVDNFRQIAAEIAEERTGNGNLEKKFLAESTTRLLRQVSQYVICVLFAADRDEDRVFGSLRDLGIPITPKRRYEVQPAGLLWSMIAFGAAIFCISLLIDYLRIMPAQPPAANSPEDVIEFTGAAVTAFAAASVIYFPALFVFLAKFLMVSSWEVRGAFSSRSVATPMLLSAFIGAIIGFIALFLLGEARLLKHSEAWLTYSPFCVLSALTACVAAWCVDYRSRPFRLTRSLKRAAGVAAVGAIAFLVLGLTALRIHRELLGQASGDMVVAGAFFGLTGLCTAFLIAVISDYFGRVPDDQDEIDLIFARYVEPFLPTQFSTMSREQLGHEMARCRDKWGPEISGWLNRTGIVDDDFRLTDSGFRRITWKQDGVPETAAWDGNTERGVSDDSRGANVHQLS